MKLYPLVLLGVLSGCVARRPKHKTGICPKKEPIFCIISRDECFDSTECPGDLLCCDTYCGKTCKPPEPKVHPSCYGLKRNRQICCNRRIISKKVADGCCKGIPFKRIEFLCCNKKLVPRRYMDQACCGDLTYDMRTQVDFSKLPWWPDVVCCNQVIYDKSPKDYFCCGSTLVCTETDFCCGGFGYRKRRGIKCCSGNLMNRKIHLCCNGNFHWKRKSTDRCCGDSPFDPTTTSCSNADSDSPNSAGGDTGVYAGTNTEEESSSDESQDDTDNGVGGTYGGDGGGGESDVEFQKHCRNKPYNPQKELCCAGHIFKKNWTTKKCCGVLAYNPTIFHCCNNQIHKFGEKIKGCCGKVSYLKTRRKCCRKTKKIVKKGESCDESKPVHSAESGYSVSSSTEESGGYTADSSEDSGYNGQPSKPNKGGKGKGKGWKRSHCSCKEYSNLIDLLEHQIYYPIQKPHRRRYSQKPHDSHSHPILEPCKERHSTVYKLKYCCDGVSFDPRIQMCCRGQLRYKGPQDTSCCGVIPYAPHAQFCCGGQVFALYDTIACCSGQPYDTRFYLCCDGYVVEKKNKFTSCCGGYAYDTSKQRCIKNEVFNMGDMEDCNGQQYNPQFFACCEGVVAPRSPCDTACCWAVPYNPYKERCVNGQVVVMDDDEMEEECPVSNGEFPLFCPGAGFYDPKVSICCGHHGGLIFSRNEFDFCCAGRPYNSTKKICCQDTLHPKDDNDACCGVAPFNSKKNKCCDFENSFVGSLTEYFMSPFVGTCDVY